MTKGALILTIFVMLLALFLFLIRDLYLPGEENATIPPERELSEFERCVADGNIAMKSLPAQCKWPNGTTVTEERQVFCTADAKLCPDGSAVGRVGPNCEFAPCPVHGNDAFAQCVTAGNPIMESYPRQCRWENGTLTTENAPVLLPD